MRKEIRAWDWVALAAQELVIMVRKEKEIRAWDCVALAAQELGAGTKIGSLTLILRKEKEIEKLRLVGCPWTWREYDIK